MMKYKLVTYKFLALALLVLLGFFACLSDPKEKTELKFTLDSTLIGKFDSVRVTLYPKGKDTGTSLFSKTFSLKPGQSSITFSLPDNVDQSFSAVITGIGKNGVAFEKRFDYTNTTKGPDSAVVDIKGKRDSVTVAIADSLKAHQDSLILAHNDSLRVTREDSLNRVHEDSLKVARDDSVKVYLESIRTRLSADSLACEVGDSTQARVTVKPDTAADKAFSLKTRDSLKTGISKSFVLCRDTGRVTIEVHAHRDTATATFTVTIVEKIILLQTIEVQNQAAVVDDTLSIAPVLKPADATDKGLTLTVEDTTKAKVIDGLTVIALQAGSTKVTLKANRGSAQATFTLTISSRKINPVAIAVADTSALLYDTLSPLINYTPQTATEREISFVSSDTATVATFGGSLVARTQGTAQIVATAMNGGAKDTFTVSVRGPNFLDIKPITKQWCGKCHSPTITFNLQDSLVLITKGSLAITRLALPFGNTSHMPADTIMTQRDLSLLMLWLTSNVKPVQGITVSDIEIALGDTTTPPVVFIPSNATNTKFTLESDNSASVKSVGSRLVGLALGTAKVTAHSEDGNQSATFNAKVVLPSFGIHIKPIITEKCGKCHSPTVTFNLQDSSILLLNGSESLRRLQLAKTDAARMPAEGELSPSQLTMVLSWLNAYFVPLQDVSVANDTLKLGQSKLVNATFIPANATNKGYVLTTFDTSKVKLTGLYMQGVAITTSATPMGFTTEEGKKSKTFTITVIPWPVDSLRGRDTSLVVNDSVLPEVIVYPKEATNKGYTLASLNPTIATILPSGKVKSLSVLDTAKILVTSVQNPTVKDTLLVVVGPVHPTSISVANLSILVGSTAPPVITWSPAATTDKTYTLTLVSGTGASQTVGISPPRLSGNTADTSKWRVTTVDGAKTADFKVTVGNVVATGIKLSVTGVTVQNPANVYVNTTYTPTINWTPTTTTIKNYSLTTSTGSSISFPTASTFKALAIGTGKVIATATDGPKDTLTVNILRPPFATVSGILYTNCTYCHAIGSGYPVWCTSPTAYTATDSITSVSYKGRILVRIDSAAAPMPPSYVITPRPSLAELVILRQYFGW
jgi:uncharacterized membrane protein